MTTTPSRTDSNLSPDFALEVWHRRKWLAAAVFCAALAATITAVASLPDLYRASATVLVERQQVSEAFVRPSVTAELETRIQTIHQQVMSRARLSDVITRLGLYPELRGVVPMDALVERMKVEAPLALKGVEQMSGRAATIAFTLSYSGRDPETVARVANTLAAFYVAENARSRERQAAQTAEFLELRLAEVKRELDEKAQRMRAFQLSYGGELPEQVAANLATLERLNTQLRLNGEYQIRAMERRQLIEGQLAAGDSTPPAAPPDTPEAQLAKLRRDLADLRRRFSDQYPDVRRVQAAIAALERDGVVAGTSGTDNLPAGDPVARAQRSLAGVDRELESLRQEEKTLRGLIAQYDERVENAPKRQQELQQLSRDHEITNERYQGLLKKFEEASLAENLEQGQNVEQFRILDPAIPPALPAAPNRFGLLLMGLAGSLALAVAAMVAAERFDTTFHDVDDVRAFTSVPTLATIRQIDTQAATRRLRLRTALMTASAVAGIALLVACTYYVAGGNEQLVRMMTRGAS